MSINKKGYHLLNGEMKAFIMNVYDHFSVSSKCAGAVNKIFYLEMQGNNLFKHVSTKWLLLPAIEKMLNCWSAIIFKLLGQEEYPFLIWE